MCGVEGFKGNGEGVGWFGREGMVWFGEVPRSCLPSPACNVTVSDDQKQKGHW